MKAVARKVDVFGVSNENVYSIKDKLVMGPDSWSENGTRKKPEYFAVRIRLPPATPDRAFSFRNVSGHIF